MTLLELNKDNYQSIRAINVIGDDTGEVRQFDRGDRTYKAFRAKLMRLMNVMHKSNDTIQVEFLA